MKYSSLAITGVAKNEPRIVASKRNYEARNPDHARVQLELELPGQPWVARVVPLSSQKLAPEAFNELKDLALRMFDAAGFTEIDPNRLTLTSVTTKEGDVYHSYLFAVVPAEN